MALIQLLLGCNPIDAAELRAFPGAEGFGAYALGGRGGRVIEVTNLNDSGSGSLRNCIIASGSRTCVFRTGGTITLNSQLLITNPNLTIAGQTAPGGGIALRSAPTYSKTLLMINAPNVIVRHIRVRPGLPNPGLPVGSQQALQIGNGGANVYNVIIDHVSASWGIDGVMQTGSTVHDITIQNSIISEGLNDAGHDKGPHSRGMNFYVGENNFDANVNMSFHHNLLSHVQYRVPQISTRKGMVEVINNVVYHTTQRGMNINCAAHPENGNLGDAKTRFIKNYELRTVIPSSNGDITVDSVDPVCEPGTAVYAKGNIGPNRNNDSMADNSSMNASDRYRWTADPTLGGTFPFPAARVTEDASAIITLQKISGTGAFAGQKNVGATLPSRDPVDTRIVSQLTNYLANRGGPGTVPVPGGPNGGLLDDPAQVGGYPVLAAGTAPIDTDHDGMPDLWEQQYGFDPNDATDGAEDAELDGYTNVEEFLNGTDPQLPDTGVPPGGDTTPPTVSITEPVSTATLSGTVVLKADATDSGGGGIAGVQFKLDGNNLGPEDKTPPYSLSWDTTTVADGAHTLTSVARDAAGNSATASPITVIVNNPLTTVNFTPVADATIKATQASNNFGKGSELHVDNSPASQFLIKFSISGIGTRRVISAKVRLYSADPADKGGEFHRVPNSSWSEQTVTWNNAPVADTAVLASLGSVITNTWYEVDLTSLITGDGTYSIKANSPSSDRAAFHSRESAGFAPKLVVTTK